MKCPLCQNDDERYMLLHNNAYLCRKCITYQTGLVSQNEVSFNEDIDPEYNLSFSLSQDQLSLSEELLSLVQAGKDVLVYAACGAGKTEIVLDLIKESLLAHKRLAIAIPRRQVVLELHKRLSTYFKNLDIIAVCEGYTEVIYGDLIICTTHQLFRYEKYFDLIILDEPDAFPYAGDELLHNLLKRSLKGPIVYLTATPDSKLLNLPKIKLFKRFHGYPLLVPDVFIGFKITLFLKLIKYIQKHKNLIIFVPTIEMAKLLSKILRIPCVHSKTENKEELIEAFSQKEFDHLLATTILERGVTFEGVNICVIFAENPVFSKASLIQIAGRVGRSPKRPEGFGLFLLSKKSKKVEECIRLLNMMNA